MMSSTNLCDSMQMEIVFNLLHNHALYGYKKLHYNSAENIRRKCISSHLNLNLACKFNTYYVLFQNALPVSWAISSFKRSNETLLKSLKKYFKIF